METIILKYSVSFLFFYLHHQHNPPFGLSKRTRIAANHRIYLIGCNGLAILADM